MLRSGKAGVRRSLSDTLAWERKDKRVARRSSLRLIDGEREPVQSHVTSPSAHPC